MFENNNVISSVKNVDPAGITASFDNARVDKAEDIFAGVADVPAKIETRNESIFVPIDNGQVFIEQNSESEQKKQFIFTVIGAFLILILLVSGWIFFNKYMNAKANNLLESENSNTQQKQIETTPINEAKLQPVNNLIKSNDVVNEDKIVSTDTDGDGLSDEEEDKLGTDKNKVDTDGDGLFDRDEVKVYHSDPLNVDTDGDGMLDGAEVREGRSPVGNGSLYDKSKTYIPSSIATSSSIQQSKADSDNDGLTDDEEQIIGTNPSQIDTDNDGLSDNDEIKKYQTDPLISDTDNDGFSDGNEIKNGFNPKGSGKK